MPKPAMSPELEALERDIIKSLTAGLKQWRSDLNYPESYSDMQGAVRGMLQMFDVERRALPRNLYPKES